MHLHDWHLPMCRAASTTATAAIVLRTSRVRLSRQYLQVEHRVDVVTILLPVLRAVSLPELSPRSSLFVQLLTDCSGTKKNERNHSVVTKLLPEGAVATLRQHLYSTRG